MIGAVINAAKGARGWDRWAPVYRGLERLTLGCELEHCRAVAADALAIGIELRATGHSGTGPGVRRPPHCLILGDGDGRGLECILHRIPDLACTSVDVSREMIRLAERRIGEASSVTWIRADLLEGCPVLLEDEAVSRVDAVMTQFFLDCFTEGQLAGWWHTVAKRVPPGGCWVVADFAPPAALEGWRSLRQRIVLWVLYRAFGWTTPMRARSLPDLDHLFRAAGWTLELSRDSPSRITRVRLWVAPGPAAVVD